MLHEGYFADMHSNFNSAHGIVFFDSWFRKVFVQRHVCHVTVTVTVSVRIEPPHTLPLGIFGIGRGIEKGILFGCQLDG